MRFGVFTLSPGDRVVPAGAKVIHVEADPLEIGRVRDVALGIPADSRETLKALLASHHTRTHPGRTSWQRTVRDADTARRQRLEGLPTGDRAAIHPYRAAQAVAGAADEDTILIGDGAEAHQWLAEVARPGKPGRYFTHGQLGCLGFGLGFAIGAQVAHPDRRVLLLTGDGAVGFTMAEFDTMARHRLPIVVVVFNNRAWGASRHFQELFSGPGRYTATKLAETRYDLVAKGFGGQGRLVEEPTELTGAIRAAFASGEPTCINVLVDFAAMPPDAEMLMSSF